MDRNGNAFKALQKTWYGKLADSGFDDIEQDDGHLKLWASRLFVVHHNATLYEAKETYYRMAGQFLHEHPFENEADRISWELHSQGVSIRDIVTELKSRGIKAYKQGVNSSLQRLVKLMMSKPRE